MDIKKPDHLVKIFIYCVVDEQAEDLKKLKINSNF